MIAAAKVVCLNMVMMLHFLLVLMAQDSYTLLEERIVHGVKATLIVELRERRTRQELAQLAYDLREKMKNQPRTFIFFVLPDMPRGSSAWATAHFDPKLKVEILGATAEEIAAWRGLDSLPNEIGRWQEKGNLSNLTLFYIQDSRLKLRAIFKDSQMTEDLHYEEGRFWYGNAEEYMKIESNGNLGWYGPQGKIKEVPRVNPPGALTTAQSKTSPLNPQSFNWKIATPKGPPEPSGETIARVGEQGVTPPVFTKRVPPDYPERAAKIHLQGYVILEAILRKNGAVENIKILRGLGRGKYGFEKAAADAVKKWQYVPGKVDGKPADVRMTLKIDFVL